MSTKQGRILITGAAGFIGYHLCQRLLDRGDEVTGLDSLNDYYDVQLKKDRLAELEEKPGFSFVHLNLADRSGMEELFKDGHFKRVVNLAAQAGVRYSLTNPHAYIESNLVGFANVLEGCRHHDVQHLVYASSSSVYGANETMPFSVHDNVDHPVSLYAATKKSNELMAHSYSYLYALPTTGLRFFTVYGPWGRPDMAYFSFTRDIVEGRPINVFNNGNMKRDFTYIDDVVEGIVRILDHPAKPDTSWNGKSPDPGSSRVPWRVYNVGNNRPVELTRFIEIIEQCLGKKANRNYLPMQPGDIVETFADIDALVEDFNYQPITGVEKGIARFVEWYREYYGV